MEATDLRVLGLRQRLVGSGDGATRDDDESYPSFFRTTATGFDDDSSNNNVAMEKKPTKRVLDKGGGRSQSPSTPLPAKLSPLSLPKRLSPTLPPMFEKRLFREVNGLGITTSRGNASSSDGDEEDDDDDRPLSKIAKDHHPVVGLGISSAKPPSLIVCLKIPESKRKEVARLSKRVKRSQPPPPTSTSSSLSSEDTTHTNNDRTAITPASTPPDTIGPNGAGAVACTAGSSSRKHNNNKLDEVVPLVPGSREWTPSPPGSPQSHNENGNSNVSPVKKDQTSRQIPATPSRGKTRVATPSSPVTDRNGAKGSGKSIKKPPVGGGKVGVSNDGQQHRPDLILHRKFSHWSELARTRKHMADDAFRNKDYRLGLVCGVDTVICYLMSFDYEDKYQQFTDNRGIIDCRSWLSLRPYMSFLIGAAQDSGNLVIAGLLHQMRAVIYQRISHHCKDSIAKIIMQHNDTGSGSGGDLEKFTTTLIEYTNNLTKALDYTRTEWFRSCKLLSPEVFATTFPETFAKRDNNSINYINEAVIQQQQQSSSSSSEQHQQSHSTTKSLRPSQDKFSLPLHSYSTITDAAAVGYNALKEWAGNLQYSWAVESVR